jgi:hypothetical protein
MFHKVIEIIRIFNLWKYANNKQHSQTYDERTANQSVLKR